MMMACHGCASSNFVILRDIPESPLAVPLNLLSKKGPKPTDRTVQLLRRYDLDEQLKKKPDHVTSELERIIDKEPSGEKIYALAELAYIDGRKLESQGDDAAALDRYGEVATNAYMFLLDSRLDWERNPYDPQFRRACDLYNGALERLLRILKKRGELKPGQTYSVSTPENEYDVFVELRGSWRAEDFGSCEFVSDYKVEGLTNQYRTFGLGVPLIVTRQNHDLEEPTEKYYPPGLTFPVTALLRVLPSEHQSPDARQRCVLEFYDPLVTADISVAGRLVPLETDLSTPLAYFLEQPEFKEKNIATFGLLKPDSAQAIRGLYMLEPYDARKIPVLMVHGLWSSPLTWMEMFNDLRGLAEIRQNYQFWFYLYPTGQPFWISATQLRADLQEMRQRLDPEGRIKSLNQMVLVGHSMGGLVSKLQTLDSHNDYWKIVSEKPFAELNATPELRESLANTFFFQANPSIQRVVTIATPHRGSEFSNSATQWISRWLIEMPQKIVRTRDEVLKDNPNYFLDTRLLSIDTSIDSLSPDSPVLPIMLRSPRDTRVKYHNIIGHLSEKGMVGRVAGESDGVVTRTSAHLDDVASEIEVNADHVNVHRHPKSILEVRRILLEHIISIQQQRLAQYGQTTLQAIRFPASSPR